LAAHTPTDARFADAREDNRSIALRAAGGMFLFGCCEDPYAWPGVEGTSGSPAMVARDDEKMTTTPRRRQRRKRKQQGERKGNAC
jgi:hypothetical protein